MLTTLLCSMNPLCIYLRYAILDWEPHWYKSTVTLVKKTGETVTFSANLKVHKRLTTASDAKYMHAAIVKSISKLDMSEEYDLSKTSVCCYVGQYSSTLNSVPMLSACIHVPTPNDGAVELNRCYRPVKISDYEAMPRLAV